MSRSRSHSSLDKRFDRRGVESISTGDGASDVVGMESGCVVVWMVGRNCGAVGEVDAWMSTGRVVSGITERPAYGRGAS